jgi:hypothetical protein
MVSDALWTARMALEEVWSVLEDTHADLTPEQLADVGDQLSEADDALAEALRVITRGE